MDKNNEELCPICKNKRIKRDRYYIWHCKECKAEWIIVRNKVKEILVNYRKEFII